MADERFAQVSASLREPLLGNDLIDMKINLTDAQLIAIIGQANFENLRRIFGQSYDEIVIRRCQATGKFINFHTDQSLRTMQVSINSDRDYQGGQLMYLTNGKVIVPSRTAGTITIHENNIVHGVTELVSGTRYGLFFLKKTRK